ncbi:MAG: hypothetical protein WBQ43_01800 [Terriglobales bacterium]
MSTLAAENVSCKQVRHGWKIATLLLQLRVLRFRFSQDGDVWVGVFPEREEISDGQFELHY